MSRFVSRLATAVLATALAAPAAAADWLEDTDFVEIEYTDTCGDGGFRGSFEPGDWAGLGDACDPLTFEFGLRYWYSLGAHRMDVLGDSYTESDTSHIVEGHLRIDDESSDVYVKGIAGYSAVINASFSTPTLPAGTSQAGRILYAGADVGYAPLGEGGTMFGGFVGYQYWNDSPDMWRVSFTGGSLPNDINYHMVRLGLAGRVDFGGVVDVTAELAAIPYAPVWGTYGAFDGSAAPGTQTSAGSLNGWLYGAAGEVMARFRPTENWAIGIGGRAWYLTGQADVNFSTDDAGGTNWVTQTTHFSTLRYGLLGEVTYRF